MFDEFLGCSLGQVPPDGEGKSLKSSGHVLAVDVAPENKGMSFENRNGRKPFKVVSSYLGATGVQKTLFLYCGASTRFANSLG